MITRNLPRALGALAILATAFAVIAAGAVPAIGAQLQHVFVTNDADNPVPTAAQGVTQVAGTVAVAAPDEQVVQFRRSVGIGDGTGNIVRPLYDVPDGKRLIIDNVAGTFLAIEDSDFFVEIGELANQFTLSLDELPGFGDRARYVADEDGPIYVDAVQGAQDELLLRVFRDRETGTALTFTVTVAGRLVDLPS